MPRTSRGITKNEEEMIMKIEAIKRFNQHDPGDVFEAEAPDAEKWIAAGVARKPDKTPPADKTVKDAVTK